jgi:hypothetical protein
MADPTDTAFIELRETVLFEALDQALDLDLRAEYQAIGLSKIEEGKWVIRLARKIRLAPEEPGS